MVNGSGLQSCYKAAKILCNAGYRLRVNGILGKFAPMKPDLGYITRRFGIIMMLAMIVAATIASCSEKAIVPVSRCEITDAMDSLVDRVFPGENAPGAIVFVIKDGEVMYKRCSGLANLKTGEPLTENTLINISSVSKIFAVAGIMKLAEKGLIDLEAPLSDYFPEFNKDVFGKINLIHILTHATGLPDNRPRNEEQWKRYIGEHPDSPFLVCYDYIRYGKDTELTRFYMTVDSLKNTPGTVFFYQDPPFMLISRIIEKVTDETFEDWMKENIFDAASLETACYVNGKMEGRGIAHGYKAKAHDTRPDVYVSNDSLWEEFDYGEAPFFMSRVDKGVFITPAEYVKWLDALYGGEIINRNSLNLANARHMESSWRDVGYSFGSFVSGGTPERPSKIFHNNGNGGFTVFESVFPDDKVAYFIFSNYSGWNRMETSKKVDRILESHSWIRKQE